jgi:DNA-directed RNA polymerase subunit H
VNPIYGVVWCQKGWSQLAKKIDILKHILVPKTTKLSEKEIKELLDQYNISKVQLPSISIKDPLAKALGLETNDIIKIERQSPTGKNYYFRRAIE